MPKATSAVDIMSLAWAFFRAPSLKLEQFQGTTKLPEGLTHLLKVAAGNSSQMETLCTATGASAAQLQEAALFFVKQVFFSSNANHYRVLGVEADAGIDQIKEHHRLLMRLFHPDLGNTSGSWEDVYATRVNQSYNILRNLESRHLYDAGLKKAAQLQPPPTQTRQKRYYSARYPPGESYSSGWGLPRVVKRNLPQFVLGGLSVLAFIVIFLFYLPGKVEMPQTQPEDPANIEEDASRSEVTLTQENAENSTIAKEDPGPDVKPLARVDEHLNLQIAGKLGLKEVTTHQEVINVSGLASMAPVAVAWSDSPPMQPVRHLDGPTPAPKMDAAPHGQYDPGHDSYEPLKAPAIVPASIPLVATVLPTASAPPQAETTPATPAAAPHSISNHEIDTLLERFVSSYQQGDIEIYMALFEDQAQTSEMKGKLAIRMDYESLFSSSMNRQMSLRNLHWVSEGASASGEGRFLLRIRSLSSPDIKYYSGTVRLELVKQKDRLLIKGFYYDYDATK